MNQVQVPQLENWSSALVADIVSQHLGAFRQTRGPWL